MKKPNVHDEGAMGGWFFVDKNSKYEAKNHPQFDEITSNGDGTADLMFNVEPDSVYLQFRDMSQAGDKAMVDIPTVKKTVSKEYLINTYYKTDEQRKHVDNCSKSILSEEVWDKQYDKSMHLDDN